MIKYRKTKTRPLFHDRAQKQKNWAFLTRITYRKIGVLVAFPKKFSFETIITSKKEVCHFYAWISVYKSLKKRGIKIALVFFPLRMAVERTNRKFVTA